MLYWSPGTLGGLKCPATRVDRCIAATSGCMQRIVALQQYVAPPAHPAPSGRAGGVGRVKPIEPQAGGRHLIQHRRPQMRVAVITRLVPAVIVPHAQDDVRPLLGGRRGVRRREDADEPASACRKPRSSYRMAHRCRLQLRVSVIEPPNNTPPTLAMPAPKRRTTQET